jgi:hypothetical protein
MLANLAADLHASPSLLIFFQNNVGPSRRLHRSGLESPAHKHRDGSADMHFRI